MGFCYALCAYSDVSDFGGLGFASDGKGFRA